MARIAKLAHFNEVWVEEIILVLHTTDNVKIGKLASFKEYKMGIRTVIILSILAMLFGIIIVFVWADQRRQQKRLRTIARQNRENRDRSRSNEDPLLNEVSGSGPFDDGILSAPRIVSQSASTSTPSTNAIPTHRPPAPPTARTIQASSATTTTTRTPRITPYPTPPLGQTPGYKAAQSAARLQAIKQKPLNPKFVPQSLSTTESVVQSDNLKIPEIASTHLTIQITDESNQQDNSVLFEETVITSTEFSTDTVEQASEELSTTTESTEEIQQAEQKSTTLPPYLTFSIMADKDKSFGGYELLQAILGCGLRHGERQIFHRYDSTHPTKILFSLASIAKPGIFSLENMGAFSTPGLIFIFEIEQTPELLNSFELLLQTARQLNDELDGNLLDDQREPLTTERIQFLREQLREITPVADSIDDR